MSMEAFHMKEGHEVWVFDTAILHVTNHISVGKHRECTVSMVLYNILYKMFLE